MCGFRASALSVSPFAFCLRPVLDDEDDEEEGFLLTSLSFDDVLPPFFSRSLLALPSLSRELRLDLELVLENVESQHDLECNIEAK